MDIIYEWKPPTKNVNGSTIPATGAGSLTSTRLIFGITINSTTGQILEDRSVPAADRSATFSTGGVAGTYFVKSYVINSYGQQSVDALALLKTVGAG